MKPDLCGVEGGLEKCWRERMWIGLVGSHGPGRLGCRAIWGVRFEVLMEESIVEGAVTDTGGLGESLAPVVTEETGTRVEAGGREKDKAVGNGDADRADAEEGEGEWREDACEGDVAEGDRSREYTVPWDTGPVSKATVFSDALEPTWEVRSSLNLPGDADNRGSVAFSMLGIHGKIGSAKEVFGASASDEDASDLEWPSLHAGTGIWREGLGVRQNRHEGLENMGGGEAFIKSHISLDATVFSSVGEAGTVPHNLKALLNFCSDPCMGEGCGDDIVIVSRVPRAKISSPGSASEGTG